MIFLVFASVVVVLWVGAQDVVDRQITAGRLSQFVLYAVFAASALGQLSQSVGRAFAGRWRGRAPDRGARGRAGDHRAAAARRRCRRAARGEVAFDRVRFAYPTRPEVAVLDDVSFRVRPGEKVAIVGPSGAGKSTIFHLILRFYDPNSGTVTFDGVRAPRRRSARAARHIALVPQDAVIFAASVADNIRFGRPDATDAEIERAAELAAAAEFIAAAAAGLRHAGRRTRRHAVGRRSASASRSRARSCAMRRCCCSTRRPPRSTPRARRWCRTALDAPDAGAHHARDRAPARDRALLRPHPGARPRPHRRGRHA